MSTIAIPSPFPALTRWPVPDTVLNLRFAPNGERVRKVVSRSGMRIRTKYASWKMGRHVQADCPGEVPVMVDLDLRPEVLRFTEQPCEITYVMDHVRHRHYPDLLVEYADRKEFIEVKNAGEETDPEWVRRTALMTKELPRFGYSYRLVTGESFKRQPRYNNAQLILRWGRAPVRATDREQLRVRFARDDEQRWGDFPVTDTGAFRLQSICRLILDGVVSIDLDQPITATSALTWVAGA